MPNSDTSDDKKRLLACLERHYGIVTPACKEADVSRDTHYRWLKEDEDYKNAVEELKNVAIDHSESKLRELIEGVTIQSGLDEETGEPIIYKTQPNVTATIFHLKTIGKKRGYVESSEMDVNIARLPPTINIKRRSETDDEQPE